MGGSKSVIAKLGNVMRRNQTAQSMFWGKTNKQKKKKITTQILITSSFTREQFP